MALDLVKWLESWFRTTSGLNNFKSIFKRLKYKVKILFKNFEIPRIYNNADKYNWLIHKNEIKYKWNWFWNGMRMRKNYDNFYFIPIDLNLASHPMSTLWNV